MVCLLSRDSGIGRASQQGMRKSWFDCHKHWLLQMQKLSCMLPISSVVVRTPKVTLATCNEQLSGCDIEDLPFFLSCFFFILTAEVEATPPLSFSYTQPQSLLNHLHMLHTPVSVWDMHSAFLLPSYSSEVQAEEGFGKIKPKQKAGQLSCNQGAIHGKALIKPRTLIHKLPFFLSFLTLF